MWISAPNRRSSLVERYPQLLVIHTLSKSRSLAGLRVGYAIGHPDLIEALKRVKDSFNSYPLDRFAIAGALAAIEDRAYFEDTCAQGGRHPHPAGGRSEATGLRGAAIRGQFRLCPPWQHDGAELAAKLRERSIIVRHFKNPARIAPFLRITVGTDSTMRGAGRCAKRNSGLECKISSQPAMPSCPAELE